ncbi:DrmB family protein [Streptomyces sp. NPDC056004]|uniref:DrmB family protein n=1 Tax=Streptomyces sp. NPDC056004 TaxID=3345677 RepID=UPI0035DD0039
MIRGKVRRSQLVAPFGPGAMQVLADGTSVITAGLDHWFVPGDKLDQEEFRIHEWRLERNLGVEALYTPPDYRGFSQNADQYNTKLQVPVLRFPAWSFCPRCRALTQHPLHIAERPRCTNANCPQQKASWAPFLAQVPFVALCQRGHLQDFPWVEWVHRTANPDCRSLKLKLRTSGGGTLASQRVVCEGCHKERGLEGITSVESPSREREDETTYLTARLEQGTDFSCRGAMPWLGLGEAGEPCGEPLRGSLRGASNLYYALVKSSIFIPEASSTGVDPRVLEALEEQTIARARANLRDVLGEGELLTAVRLRRTARKNAFRLAEFTDAQLEAALALLEGEPEESPEQTPETPGDQAPFRSQEYGRIRNTIDSTELVVREPDAGCAEDVGRLVSRVRLVEKLRETRVLWGFNRIFAESSTPDTASRMALLRRQAHEEGDSWLPAYTVLGEGIYLELDPELLAGWETRDPVQKRLAPMSRRFETVAQERHLNPRQVTPRLVLLHTLAHLLINQLTFECGYSSASLRERLYVSPGSQGMNGMLLYTAAGDSEGTLGGLVRMGQPERFEEVLKNAISNARWCSSDPVCMDSKGQGPDSCNLAACHSCALLPETACEEFNRFLDRGLVAGTLADPKLGFFSSLA